MTERQRPKCQFQARRRDLQGFPELWEGQYKLRTQTDRGYCSYCAVLMRQEHDVMMTDKNDEGTGVLG